MSDTQLCSQLLFALHSNACMVGNDRFRTNVCGLSRAQGGASTAPVLLPAPPEQLK